MNLLKKSQQKTPTKNCAKMSTLGAKNIYKSFEMIFFKSTKCNTLIMRIIFQHIIKNNNLCLYIRQTHFNFSNSRKKKIFHIQYTFGTYALIDIFFHNIHCSTLEFKNTGWRFIFFFFEHIYIERSICVIRLKVKVELLFFCTKI